MSERLVANRTVEPAIEPVTLQEAKLHLRVDNVTEDAYIDALIVAAREHVEQDTHRALITQTWERKLDRFPLLRWDAILLPRPPLQSVASVTYIDPAGATQTLSPTVYVVDADSSPGRITLAPHATWPATQDVTNAITVSYTAGYGAAAADVPQSLRHAIKLLISLQYENREPVLSGGINSASFSRKPGRDTTLGSSYGFLVTPYRVWWL